MDEHRTLVLIVAARGSLGPDHIAFTEKIVSLAVMTVRRDDERIRLLRAAWAVQLSHNMAERAHELGSGVNDIRLKLRVVEASGELSPESRELLKLASVAAGKLARLATHDPAPTIDAVMADAKRQWPRLSWMCSMADSVKKAAIVTPLVSAIAQLLTNSGSALEASGKPGSIKLSVAPDGNDLAISVETRGIGFPERIATVAFHEPIAPDGGGGSGFGLYLVGSWIIDGLGGSVDLAANDPELMSRVEMSVPLMRALKTTDVENAHGRSL